MQLLGPNALSKDHHRHNMPMPDYFPGASLVPPWCLLGASLVPPRCLLGASLHPLTWSQGSFCSSFGPLPPPKGPTLVATGPLWWHFDATWGPFLALRVTVENFGVTLSLLWAHFWHMRMCLGSLWCRPTPMKLQKSLKFIGKMGVFEN